MVLWRKPMMLSTVKWMLNHWNGIGKADTIQHTWEIISRMGDTKSYTNWAGELTQLSGLQKTCCEHLLTMFTSSLGKDKLIME